MPPLSISTISSIFSSFEVTAFERRLLSKCSVNANGLSVMNDVLVTSCNPKSLNDANVLSQMMCFILGKSCVIEDPLLKEKKVALGPVDVSCSFPPFQFPIIEVGVDEKPPDGPLCTLSARITNLTPASIVVHYVIRESGYGNEICTGQQVLMLKS
eukprot:Tbor_TRINITY_DN3692_c0_g1::TRINITY_DN3692_c0_g1_i1::g.277::m.277